MATPLACLLTTTLFAQPLPVPNASFELPVTPFADPRIDAWKTTPKPDWYSEDGGFLWAQLFGVFRNPAPGQPDHIVNAQGDQAAYLFAVPEAGLHIDQLGTGVIYRPGRTYTLTLGVLAGAGGMTNGASLAVGFHYVDAQGKRVTVASAPVVYDPNRFPSQTAFVDVQATTPVVSTADAWAGRPIGVHVQSTVAPNLVGGYWDLDHVRLAEALSWPNATFDLPVTDYVDPRMVSWQKTSRPEWYDESGGFLWDQLSGVFKNPELGKDDHLENMHGPQAAYLFAVPGVGLSLDDSNPESAAVLPTFEAGHAYILTVALQGGGGNMTNGVSLDLNLYYRDDQGAAVTVARTTVQHSPEAYPSRHHFADTELRTPTVLPTDPWAGRRMGLQILSTTDPSRAGGYWNLDQVRLRAVPAPRLHQPRMSDGRLHALLVGEAGSRVEILEAATVSTPLSEWRVVETLTNTTGFLEWERAGSTQPATYYRLRSMP